MLLHVLNGFDGNVPVANYFNIKTNQQNIKHHLNGSRYIILKDFYAKHLHKNVFQIQRIHVEKLGYG